MKKSILPSWTITQEKQIIKHANIPLLNLSVYKISFDSETNILKKLNTFYSRILDSFINFSKSSFFEYAISDYDADTNPRKKYRYSPFDLTFHTKCQVTKENNLIVNIKITVMKRKKLISEKNITHTWKIGKKRLYLKIAK